MNTRSIQVRLTLWYTLLIVTTAAAFGAYTYFSFSHRLYLQAQQTLSRRAEQVRDNILPQTANLSSEALTQQIKEIYSPEESNRFIRVTRADGTPLYVSGSPQDREFDPSMVPPPQNYTDHISARIENAGNNSALLVVGLDATVSGNNYIIEMGAPTHGIKGALHKLIATLLFGLPIVILIAAGGGSLLIRRALQPVEAIRASAEKITFGNVRQRLPVVETGDALEHLTRTLNQMLERLDTTYQQASRFSADASHELRTPLTVMRSELESIESTMHAGQLPIAIRERIGSVLEEAERLSGIVEDLFSIARLDAGEAKIEHETFDLAHLVRSTVDQMQLLAEEKRISVIINTPKSVFVSGDGARLKQVIVNLLDNAVKYTLAGGVVTFDIYEEASAAILSIEDNGIGISSEALPHIFERFYRADKVRSRDTEGAGLGLSIVRSICQAHGGTVRVQSVEGAGTTVTVILPLADKISGETTNAAA
ncbi:MAG: ATP-binding protein [Negativicutes bacterium]|nr:ATP-binding protein [Negativicutes bacterium]